MSSRDPGRNPRQVFGAIVRFYRERAGLSRSELSRQLCKSESLVQAIELGQRAAEPADAPHQAHSSRQQHAVASQGPSPLGLAGSNA